MGAKLGRESGSQTSFLLVLGSSPINRVLDFLIENDRENWSMYEISKNAGVGYSTLKILLPEMEKRKLLIIKKRIGRIKLYTINVQNPIVHKIIELYKVISNREMERYLKRGKDNT